MADYGPTPSVATPQPLYARYVHGGHTIDFTADTTTDYGGGAGLGVPFGAVLVISGMIAVATVPIPPGTKGALVIEGSFDFPKAASDGGMVAGSLWYWDDTNKVATGTSSGNTYGGKVEIAALTADTTVRVQLEAMANASGTVGFTALPVANVTATGTSSTPGNAALLSTGYNVVTGADGTKSVILPTAAVGKVVIIKNAGSSALPVFPATGAAINGLTATSGSLSLAANTCPMLIANSTAQWYSNPLLPS